MRKRLKKAKSVVDLADSEGVVAAPKKMPKRGKKPNAARDPLVNFTTCSSSTKQ